MKMKYKVKCKTEKEYQAIKKYLDDVGIAFKQKEGKSLKVDCNKNELLYYLSVIKIKPTSIKPCKGNEHPNAITGYRATNKNDGFGLVEQYDLISELNSMLPPEGVHSADDIREYEALMRLRDPSGLTRAVFERNSRSFVGDGHNKSENPTYTGGVDWRYEKGGEFYDDDYDY